jgi:hypothetical protein
MTNPTFSIQVFGIYVLIIGIGFTFIPNTVLPIFGIPTTTEVWVRVVGILALALALYYFYAARKNDLHYMRISVPGRIGFFIAMTALALLNLGPTACILFGVVDLVFALWTAFALRENGQLEF